MSSILSDVAPVHHPPKLRAFNDIPALRDAIYDKVLDAARDFTPLSNAQHTLKLDNVDYQGDADYTPEDEKKAVLTGASLGRKLRGDWTLLDNATGKVLDTRRVTLGSVPHLTRQGVFINNGTQYTLSHQFRLRPGSYTRVKSNGELENHINIAPGRGYSHRISLDPDTGVFRFVAGQSRLPLYGALRLLGVGDSELQKAWGPELVAVNKAKDDPQTLSKLYSKLVRGDIPAAKFREREDAVRAAFAKMQIDPEVTQRTLGAPYASLTPETYLAITKKLLAVHRGEQPPDERDAPVFQQLLGPEDLFAERIRQARAQANPLLWKASNRGNLEHIHAGVFNDAIHAALLASGLGAVLEQTNPLDVLDQHYRVSRMGYGGITNETAIPAEARAVMPGQLGYVDILRAPESFRAGVDARLARVALKGKNGDIYTPILDVKTGKVQAMAPRELADAVVAFPRELESRKTLVSALVRGEPTVVPRESVQYAIPHMENTFSAITNLVPMKSMLHGQRAVMGSRMSIQALPLVGGEAPFVQSALPEDNSRSFEEEYGTKLGAVTADKAAHITAVAPDAITLREESGNKRVIPLYHDYPNNRKTGFNQTPLVKPGQLVQPGDLLARSNFTDEKGRVALGRNLRVAYITDKGHNYEDAISLSETAAKKFTSEHYYQHKHDWASGAHRGLDAYRSLFPGTYTAEMLDKFDKNGLIRPGTVVDRQHPLILNAEEREMMHNSLHRSRKSAFNDNSILWEHDTPGIVTDVVHTPRGVNVVVKTHAPLIVGDKLSGRFGDKGVVSRIVPDDEMPIAADGKPAEIMINPMGLISRRNPIQILEGALGKIAERTGQGYKLPAFQNIDDGAAYGLAELQKHGLPPTETITDPRNGRQIPGVFVANRYFMKLHHTSEGGDQSRGLGGYTADQTPSRGGSDGSKKIAMLELSALLSHGVPKVIREAHLVRGQASPEYWSQFMAGQSPPVEKVPFVYHKFLATLAGAGIHPVRTNHTLRLMAMTDRDVSRMAGDRSLKNAELVDWRDAAREIPGGLFDKELTGGHGGTQWSKLDLHARMPNPVMEEPIRRVLGLTEPAFRDVLAGNEELGGKTGPDALYQALDAIDLPREISLARHAARTAKKTARDIAIRRLQYLQSAETTGVHPRDWTLKSFPVIPPVFRPVSVMGVKKLPLIADANYLYKEAFDANHNLREASKLLGTHVQDERLVLYDALKGVAGLGDPIHPKNQERNVKGLLRAVFGNSPKTSVVQKRLLGTSADLVGRSVITPDPSLDMDHVGLPEETAWGAYAPVIVRDLVRRGMPRLEAARAVEARSPAARQALVQAMDARPVLINRAPTLHKLGFMAAWPRLMPGHTMRLSPIITKGFNADFDGDKMQYHVLVSDEAARDALKTLPSRNLLSPAHFGAYPMPAHEYLAGLHTASTAVDTKNKPLVFATRADAIAAYKRGEIGPTRQVEILRP